MDSIKRILVPNEGSELFLLATYVLSTPRIHTEAIVVFPGMGEDERVIHAIDRCCNENFKYLLVAGLNLNEKTARAFTVNTLRQPPFELPKDLEARVFTQVEACNTLLQAEWTAELVKEHKISSLTLSVSPYHLPRAYLTLLNSLLKRGLRIPLIPDPTPASALVDVPELGLEAQDMVAGEVERIRTYQYKGDVTQFETYLTYNQWLLGCINTSS